MSIFEFQPSESKPFRDSAPSAQTVFSRTYSRRKEDGTRENFREAMTRTINDIARIGKLGPDHHELIMEQALAQRTFPSGRAFWVAGTEWGKKPENFSGYYNCTSSHINDLEAFGLLVDLAMQGSGTGAVLEQDVIDRLPVVSHELEIVSVTEVGSNPDRRAETVFDTLLPSGAVGLSVGDSRKGWQDAYQLLINWAHEGLEGHEGHIRVHLDLGNVRPSGERLKGFGGTSNPVKLESMFRKVVDLLNTAVGRKLTTVEACLLIDEAATAIVAGNIRRCLPGHALVSTPKGLIRMDKITVGTEVHTPMGLKRVTDKFIQGEQPVTRVLTNGPDMLATPNHEVAIMGSSVNEVRWVKVSELKEGDRLLHSNWVANVQEAQPSWPYDATGNRSAMSRAKDLTTPSTVTPAAAWLVGYTHGNGYVSLGTNKHGKPYGSVSWSCDSRDKELSNLLSARINKALSEFGLSAAVKKVKGENTLKITCSSIRFAEYFFKNVKQPKAEFSVPCFILEANDEIRGAYLAGLFDSDGSIKTRPVNLVTTIYRNFAEQVSRVASSLGIPTRLRTNKAQRAGWNDKFHVNVVAFKDRFNAFIACHSMKGCLSLHGLRMNGFTIPGEVARNELSYSELRGLGFNGSKNVDINFESWQENVEELNHVPVTVLGFGQSQVLSTYDITVEDAHCFYADGYLTHNSAGMRQFSQNDEEAATAKLGLYSQDEDGNWRVDPKKEALRMANHTRCYHTKPSYQAVEDAVRLQFSSGEGAIQYVPEAVARANADLLGPVKNGKKAFLQAYTELGRDAAKKFLLRCAEEVEYRMDERELSHRMDRYGLNPCGEIVGRDFHCNLSEVHLNTIAPDDYAAQEKAFYAGGLQVASLLQHEFVHERYQYSREIDPIVGVSFTGFFDFMVHAGGYDWLKWMMEGRKGGRALDMYGALERDYLRRWREAAHRGVKDYCEKYGIRVPNRITTVQPAGTKSLLTGASSGWHAPKSQRFIRRITLGVKDPLVPTLLEQGYSVIPAQSARDDEGNLLDDIADPRVQEVLVEIPTEVSWANLPGCDQFDLSQLPVESQYRFYMQVQQYYTDHNTSATIELREHEVPILSKLIYDDIENNGGYISAALLARFDVDGGTFPRLPFEPITKEKYDELMQIQELSGTDEPFLDTLNNYDSSGWSIESVAGCSSAACLAKADADEREKNL